MKQWQKDFLELYKRKEIEINGKLFTVQTGKNKTISSVHSSALGILYVLFDKKSYLSAEDVKISMEYWENFALEERYQLIIIDRTAVKWGKEKMFNSLGYHVLPEQLNRTLSKGHYFKQLAKGSQKQITKKFTTVIEALNERKQKEALFVYELNPEISLRKITIYYKGYDGTIRTHYENGHLVFSFEQEAYILTKKEDIHLALDSILQKINYKMRIKNQFTTPRKFFDEKMRDFHYSEKRKNDIHAFLLNTYPWEEIEYYFYHLPENKRTKTTVKSLLYPEIRKIMHHFFFMDYDQLYAFHEDKKEQALEKYKELATKRAAAEATKHFNESI